MRALIVSTIVLGVLATSGQAQSTHHSSSITVNRGSIAIEPFGGYLVSQTFFTGPLNTKLGVNSAPLYGVQASLPLAPGGYLVGGIGYASGNLDVGLPIIGGLSLGTSNTTLYDLSIELRLEKYRRSRFIPVFQLGGGAIHRNVNVAGAKAHTTDFEVSGGVGADMPINSRIAMRVMAKDHWGKADFGNIGPLSAKTDDLHTVALSGGLRIAF